MNTSTNILSLLGAALLTTACAHEPSQDLQTARSLYAEAEQGQAANVAQAELYEAKTALDKAESLKKRKVGSIEEQDLAYVAARKAQYAMSVAAMKDAKTDATEASNARTELLAQQRDASQEQLAETSKELQNKEEKLQASEAEQAELKARLDKAMASLEEIASIKDEKDRMVITLSGSVLFKTASADLLPSAQRKLQEVATVLSEYDENHSIMVEGHTDARGSTDYNATLSLHRAQAVEQFLETQGVNDSSLKSVGRGESEPIADNSSAEGRANNRRVEIVIDKTTVAAK